MRPTTAIDTVADSFTCRNPPVVVVSRSTLYKMQSTWLGTRAGTAYAWLVLAAEARRMARQQLAGQLPRRWRHSRAVAEQAEALCPLVPNPAGLVCAAWLHDIGYAPDVAVTGLHALDGARYLRASGIDPLICSLVAHHSGAIYEARERGLDKLLEDDFPLAPQPLSDALWYCDMVTGPDGSRTTLDDRLGEIRRRYGEGHVVTSAIESAEVELTGAMRRIEAQLSTHERLVAQPMYGSARR